MSWSLNELKALSIKAARGAGMPVRTAVALVALADDHDGIATSREQSGRSQVDARSGGEFERATAPLETG